MTNIALFVAGIAGAVAFDAIMCGVVYKSLRDILGELITATLLRVISWLLSLDGEAKKFLQDNFVFWIALSVILVGVIVMIWLHVAEIIYRDERRRRDKKRCENCHYQMEPEHHYNDRKDQTPSRKRKKSK